MTSLSNDQGRAYEFQCISTLHDSILKYRPVQIIKDDHYHAAERAWNNVDPSFQNLLKISAIAAVDKLFELEPLILENDDDLLTLSIQPDSQGEKGDVRDVLIIRKSIKWEIGLSLKHNHFAVKHSRLSRKIDFGEKWFGDPCTQTYWNEITPIFDYLDKAKDKGLKWRDLPDKINDVYMPLLDAFKKELMTKYQNNPQIPKKMIEYLLGEFDFYKVISVDKDKLTRIQSFNLRGTLNKPGKRTKSTITVPHIKLPSEILCIKYKKNCDNTLILCMDEGWQFSFRIHNAKTDVEPSLKFDIQMDGIPTTIMTINCMWA